MNPKDYASPELSQKLDELGVRVPNDWVAWWAAEDELSEPILTDSPDEYEHAFSVTYPADSGTCLGWVLRHAEIWERQYKTLESEPDERAKVMIQMLEDEFEDELDVKRINKLLQEWASE